MGKYKIIRFPSPKINGKSSMCFCRMATSRLAPLSGNIPLHCDLSSNGRSQRSVGKSDTILILHKQPLNTHKIVLIITNIHSTAEILCVYLHENIRLCKVFKLKFFAAITSQLTPYAPRLIPPKKTSPSSGKRNAMRSSHWHPGA